MNAQQIRRAYIQFFEARGHKAIPRALLVPQNDPTTLFTGSGMQPMIPYLLGEKHPEGVRLVDSQTCLRVQDMDEVGNNRHTTFFEMIGNWSLGDYFKKEQIEWMFEFLTDVVGLDPNRLYITCFIGEQKYDLPKDTDAAELWQKLFADKGIEAKIADIGSEEDGYKRGMKPGERIFYYDDSKNWWSRNGGLKTTPIGDPCGPDAEMFYDFGIEHDPKWGKNCHPNCDCGRFIEIGNNVFMGYKKEADGVFVPLKAPNIDHGSGLERIAAAAINSSDVFKISLLWPIVEKLEELSGKQYDSHTNAMRVIADHLRGAMFLAVDGVVPSNKEQGYVARRLMRRAILQAFHLGIEQNFIQEVAPVIADMYHEDFPEVAKKRDQVIEILIKEEKVFRQTLRSGVRFVATELPKLFHTPAQTGSFFKLPSGSKIAKVLFTAYDTHGFPYELGLEEYLSQRDQLERNAPNMLVLVLPQDTADIKTEFDKLMQEQRARSQTASKGTFKGGLGGQTLQHKKYHTATHLMYQALRDVLGKHVIQRGSNITEERLRFDFSHDQKVTPEQIKQVEAIVNEQIQKDLKVSWAEYPTAEATGKLGALGQFGDRYGDTVKVYKMIADDAQKPFSFEICGGPHVDHTSQLAEEGKTFKILKEEASSAGVRRIKAALV